MHRKGMWAKLPQLFRKPDFRVDIQLAEVPVNYGVAMKIDRISHPAFVEAP